MRHQPHHRLGAALGERHVAFDLDQAPQPIVRGKPEDAALDDAAAQPFEMGAHQRLPLGLGQLRKTQLDVALRDAPARAGHRMQQPADAAPQRSEHRQRQPMQQPQHAKQQTRSQRQSFWPAALASIESMRTVRGVL